MPRASHDEVWNSATSCCSWWLARGIYGISNNCSLRAIVKPPLCWIVREAKLVENMNDHNNQHESTTSLNGYDISFLKQLLFFFFSWKPYNSVPNTSQKILIQHKELWNAVLSHFELFPLIYNYLYRDSFL